MLETDNMGHLDKIEAAAIKVGLECRRHQIRSLTVIQIREHNGEWILFDPIRRGKDMAKLIFAAAKNAGIASSESDFRIKIVKELASNDFTL